MKRLFWIGMLLVMVSDVSFAAVIKEGVVACRNERALVEVTDASAKNDAQAQETMKWLMDGAACLYVPKDTPVEVVHSTASGNVQLRTTGKRRNLSLWVNRQHLSAN